MVLIFSPPLSYSWRDFLRYLQSPIKRCLWILHSVKIGLQPHYFAAMCTAHNWPAEGAVASLVRHIITMFCTGCAVKKKEKALLRYIDLFQIVLFYEILWHISTAKRGVTLQNTIFHNTYFEISGTSWTNSRQALHSASPESLRTFITIKDVISLLDIFSEIALQLILKKKNSWTVNDGRNYIAGGRQTKDQILARAGRRCRGEIREITEGVARGEDSQGTSKHFFFYRASSQTGAAYQIKNCASFYASSSCSPSLCYVPSVREAAWIGDSRVSLEGPQAELYTDTCSGTTKYSTEVWYPVAPGLVRIIGDVRPLIVKAAEQPCAHWNSVSPHLLTFYFTWISFDATVSFNLLSRKFRLFYSAGTQTFA